MLGDMNMDDNWGIILHIELQIVEIFECIPHSFDPSLECGLDSVVFYLRLEDHELHGIHLQGCHPCAGIELQVFQCLLLAFYQVPFHCLRQELYSAIDAFLHALLLMFFQSLQLSFVLIFLLKHHFMAQQAASVVSIIKLSLDLPCTYLTMLFLSLEEILIAIHADSIDDIVFLFAFLAGYNFLLLFRWDYKDLAANLTATCGLFTYACAHRTCILRQLLQDRRLLFVYVHTFRTRVDVFAYPCVTVRTNPSTVAHHFLLYKYCSSFRYKRISDT